jgi:hypothetical protein
MWLNFQIKIKNKKIKEKILINYSRGLFATSLIGDVANKARG